MATSETGTKGENPTQGSTEPQITMENPLPLNHITKTSNEHFTVSCFRLDNLELMIRLSMRGRKLQDGKGR
jgi:hypothetical protein